MTASALRRAVAARPAGPAHPVVDGRDSPVGAHRTRNSPHSRREAPEAEQRARALRDGPVVLLDAVVQGLLASGSPLAPQDPADRPPVGLMGTRRDALRRALGHVDQAPQDAPGSMLVPGRAAQGGEEHPLAVAGAIERAPAARNLHVGLVDVPGDPGAAAPLGPKLVPRSGAKRNSQLRIVSCVTA